MKSSYLVIFNIQSSTDNILRLASQKVPHSGYMAVQEHQTGRTWKRHISEGRPVIKTGTSPCK